MITINCTQGSPEWLDARSGATTASRFSDAIAVLTKSSGKKTPGEPTAASDKYAYEVAFERISGVPYGEPVKAWTLERGHELEVVARRKYEMATGYLASESGVVLTDDKLFGYSTDGLIEEDGLIEIKCPVDTVKIMAMITTGDTSEYDCQMQGGMWITGRKWCDFIQYVPALASVGYDLYIKRVYRNEAFIEDMEQKLLAFNNRVESCMFTLKENFESRLARR